MPRATPTEKALIDAIIDSEVDARAIADRAGELGKTFGDQANAIMTGILKARATRRITAQQGRQMWLQAFKALSLAAFVKVAQDVKDTGEGSSKKLIETAKAMGASVRKVGAVTDADKLERELEKRGELEVPDDETQGSG